MNARLFRTPQPRGRSAGHRPAEDDRPTSLGRIFAWATIAALIVGVLGLGEPVDDYLRRARDFFRDVQPSGDTVIIGIDDRSVERLGSWPWSRVRHAQLVDRLHNAGAKRIFFDIFFHTPASTKAEETAFAAAIERAGNVWLAAGYTVDRATGQIRPKLPRPELLRHAHPVSVSLNYSSMAFVRRLNYSVDYGGRQFPSMASLLSGVHGGPNESFVLDYGIDLNAIRTISASDVIDGTVPASSLRGKDIVIAVASHDIGDIYFVPGTGLINGGYINVLGGETLKQGRPIDIGWFIPLLATLLLSAIHMFARNRWIRRSAITLALAGGTVVPFIAEPSHIFFQTVPMLVLGVSVASGAAWFNFRRSYKVLGNINAVSGLPNLNALREESFEANSVLVVGRIRNFAEISSSLPIEGERALVEQIVARLALGSRGAQLYHGDEGLFAWATAPDVAGSDQLDALHALFRSPALVDGRPIDLSITFGVDSIGDRDFTNRIGSALVAADEAAVENLRWKAYDPARLADAEWKLSLLGRLDAAIDSGEIWVAYQPQLELKTGRICGAEALVRWSHPEKGAISPMEFVLAAEQHNRIDKLTEFVLSDAIRMAAGFAARGEAFDVAVNISARLLEKPGLMAIVRHQLAESGLAPERLTLEVTESAAMSSGRASIRTLEELGSLGINVSIDDYGTGFSTLEYFKKIPATEVKIDRSFVASLDRNASDRLLVRSVIELAHSLGRSVVAEGVETPEVLAELSNMGCDKVQGYLIGKPVNLATLINTLEDRSRSAAA
ncbi:EAL domain-containing protein [Sphingomonas sp. RS2018]